MDFIGGFIDLMKRNGAILTSSATRFERVPAQCYPFGVEVGATRRDPRNSNGHEVLLVILSRPIHARENRSTASAR
jgi:hypothetical protein